MADPEAHSIRIWHQATMVLENFPAFARALEAHFAKVARPGTKVELHGTHPSTYKTNYPGVDIRYVFMQHLLGQQFMLAALAAEDQRYDAFAISTLPDYGLQQARSVVDLPVVAYGESAMLASCALGRRFGVLVFIEQLAELVRENVRRYGLSARLAGVRHAGIGFSDVVAAFDEPARAIERLIESCRLLIADGTEAIIPGEAPLCLLLARNGVSAVDGVPVVDALATTVKMAESLTDLKRASGVAACRRGYFAEKPPRERLDELIAFYGMRHLLPPYA